MGLSCPVSSPRAFFMIHINRKSGKKHTPVSSPYPNAQALPAQPEYLPRSLTDGLQRNDAGNEG